MPAKMSKIKCSIVGVCLVFCSLQLHSQEIYVNRIWQLQTGEFYIELNFKDSYDKVDHQDLRAGLGPFVYKGDESSRRKVRTEIAERYLDLNNLNDLDLYGNTYFGKLRFKGIEFYQGLISESYIAVFENSNFTGKEVNRKADYYCMSSSTRKYTMNTIEVESVENDEIKRRLASRFKFSDRQLMKLTSKRFGNTLLSVVTYFGSNYENNSHLIESSDSELRILKTLKDEYVMWGLIPTPLFINEMPVLIVEMGVPETDHNWTQIGVYDGESYELLSNKFVVSLN